MAQKRPRPEEVPAIPETFDSAKIHEQTSSFSGCFSPTLSAPVLQRRPEFRTATHKIAAWRTPSRQKSLDPSRPFFDSGYDDDGESWAGTRLARVLNDTQAVGTVVVARWYGGQNIGPVRFTHIESCAKEAIGKWKVATLEAEKEGAAKKQRMDDEVRRRELIVELGQRDDSIVALRKLLAEKKAMLSGDEIVSTTPQKAMDYGKTGVQVLKRLDKARDATIAVILRQMDKVDADLNLLDGLDVGALEGALEETRSLREESASLKEESVSLKEEGLPLREEGVSLKQKAETLEKSQEDMESGDVRDHAIDATASVDVHCN